MKKFLSAVLISVVFSGLSLWAWDRGWLNRWEYPTWTWRIFYHARPSVATDQIKIIMIDEMSIDWMEAESGLSWPWPREVYGPIIEFCLRGGARAVAFDMYYRDHSRYGVHDDELFGEAIRNGPPFVGAAFLSEHIGLHTRWPDYVKPWGGRLEGLESWLAGIDPTEVIMPRASFPIPAVATNSTLIADVRGTPDPEDGVIRRSNVFRMFDGQFVPSLGFAAYLAEQRGSPRIEFRTDRIVMGRRAIPVDEKGRTLLRYRGPPDTHARYSAAQVIQSELRIREGRKPELSPVVFNNAYVLLGASAVGLLDLRPTPISDVTPGVLVHATILDNFLANDFMWEVDPRMVMSFTLVFAFIGAWLVRLTRKAWQSVVCFVLILPIPVWVAFIAYDWGFWWPMMVQVLALGLSMIGGVVVNYATEGRQKAFIKSAFKHYLSPTVIEKILEDPNRLTLGGERRELSIFFSDLQGFSSISEKLDPQALTQLLNDYLSDMTDIVLEEGGTLDKYEGDAIIAFWNAPLEQEDHALRACRTALRCQRKLAERRAEFKERTGAELRMRIGVNTGEVVVGNLGSRDRFDYTVLGDAANLAARLEGANKQFGTYTMVAGSTWEKAGEALPGRAIGRIRVVGRETPVRVYEILGEPGEATPVPVDAFEGAVRLCEEKKWKEALEQFEQWKDDPVSRKYAERCRALLAEPGETWDAVWSLTEK